MKKKTIAVIVASPVIGFTVVVLYIAHENSKKKIEVYRSRKFV